MLNLADGSREAAKPILSLKLPVRSIIYAKFIGWPGSLCEAHGTDVQAVGKATTERKRPGYEAPRRTESAL
jgi:hypothetical protein